MKSDSIQEEGDGLQDEDEVTQLREYVRLLEGVIESMPEGVALFDDSFKMILCNGNTRQILD